MQQLPEHCFFTWINLLIRVRCEMRLLLRRAALLDRFSPESSSGQPRPMYLMCNLFSCSYSYIACSQLRKRSEQMQHEHIVTIEVGVSHFLADCIAMLFQGILPPAVQGLIAGTRNASSLVYFSLCRPFF